MRRVGIWAWYSVDGVTTLRRYMDFVFEIGFKSVVLGLR